jgi:hypothetical protein
MKSRRVLWSLSSIAFASLICGSAVTEANERPRFVAEPLAEFAMAYEQRNHRMLDADHGDMHKYHAYRVSTPGSSTIVTARSVSVDALGHLHIVGEPGTVARGQISKGSGETHILLPIAVTPPR